VLTSIEICAGAGGQALGLEQAGFSHLRLVDNDADCYATLQANRRWRDAARRADLQELRALDFQGQVDLLAGGVPCPPFSRAGKQLGSDDERDLFPEALRIAEECEPRAILLENVRGLLSARFDGYRKTLKAKLASTGPGYWSEWKLFNASDYGVPQLRPRAILVAIRKDLSSNFAWPDDADRKTPKTVGQALAREMASRGWPEAEEWAWKAADIAPTLVGGSKKHGGPDLGPTQARKRWAELGVDGTVVAAEAPPPDWGNRPPRLTVRMAAIIQGFPSSWPFSGSKTAKYRQVGNAFPPPVAAAVGRSIRRCLDAHDAQAADVAALRRAA
jgi:DNA (cytosine-5)-methyltransferase 1